MRTHTRTYRVALVLVMWPAVALAGDGILEINQACAASAGCFSGDTAGFPVTIDGSAGRSYQLTSDLIVPNENTTGIEISTPDIAVDLNQFTIVRAACAGATINCTSASGTGRGVGVTSTSIIRGVAVHDGSITGMGAFGVFLGPQAELRNLRVRWNRLDGIVAFAGSTVSGNTVSENGREGISVGNGSTVSKNSAFGNGEVGIFANIGSTVSGNTASQSGEHGIVAFAGSTVSANTTRENGLDGIQATDSTISGNTSSQNGHRGIRALGTSTISGNLTASNDSNGIQADGGLITDNTAASNGAHGIAVGSALISNNTISGNDGFGIVNGHYRDNFIRGNSDGSVTLSIDLGGNHCSPTPCP